MKLLRLKITDPGGFRSLPCGFEHLFRTEWSLQEELSKPEGFAPFVCAGPNGSGKSNLLEALAAIFFQLEILRVRRSFLPEVLQSEELDFSPAAFELDYLIRVPPEYVRPCGQVWAQVFVWKIPGEPVRLDWGNQKEFEADIYQVFRAGFADILLPEFVLGYSSGENEILSLPFFKIRFVQFDEYWNALVLRLPYSGRPETRLAYLDSGFSQAILLCNLLFQNYETLQPFREDVGVEALKQFRIIIRRSNTVTAERAGDFPPGEYSSLTERAQDGYFTHHPALFLNPESQEHVVNLTQLLEGDQRTSIIEKLTRCATLNYVDETTDTLILDYWINEATKEAFRNNFDNSPLALFQALQVLLTLNLYSVSDTVKAGLYLSDNHYVSETVPTLASDQRIMRFDYVKFTKRGIEQPIQLKDLSDGEHQLLHSLGLCLLFRDTNSLFLLDEPETHFNPDWRANFISRLRQCLPGNSNASQEMLITTHTPFLISDSRPEKVLVFKKDPRTRAISISHPDYNTLGASINKITMSTFGKRETIGAYAQGILDRLGAQFDAGNTDASALIDEINRELGDSVEKILLIKAILDKAEGAKPEGRN